jgi:uracil DNA glycosylase superfamily protein
LADRNKAAALDALLGDLSRDSIGTTFNQFREVGPDDVPGASVIRLANLRHYLEERADADVVAVGEAAGYQGMRWSGIAFTSERDLARWSLPYRATSTMRKGGWSEPSGTIVHGLLAELGAERRVILWNTVPFHPHLPDQPLSNRRPTRPEIAQGIAYVERLIAIMRPRLVVAVGRVAAAILPDGAVYVRHPAQSGATAFRAGMRVALERLP